MPQSEFGRLPTPRTSFVGRERELLDVTLALARERLICLTGPGGGGKTRLALAAAEQLDSDIADGVWWIDLAPVAERGSLPDVFARSLGTPDVPGATPVESLIEHLSSRRALLVIDNCEHVRDECVELLHQLLPRCASVKALVTSREQLGLPGEVAWLVPPLSVPDSVELFRDRAAATLPGFVLDDQNADTIERICCGLDRNPLAVELAAARLRVLSVEEIADMLGDRLQVLVSGSSALPARHRTLRATLDWSAGLLTDTERQFLSELAVFEGGFTLDAARAVHAAAADGPSALELTAGLVNRSLIAVSQRGRETRYRLDETVRLYAEERLEASGSAASVRDKHLGYCVAMAERAESEPSGSAQRDWLDRIDIEWSNLLAGLRWSLCDRGDPVAALRMTTSLGRWFYLRGHYTVGRTWLDAALEAATHAPPQLRAKGLAAVGMLSSLQSEYPVATARLDAALAGYRGCSDRSGAAIVLRLLASVARAQGDFGRSRGLLEESLAEHRRLGELGGIAATLHDLGLDAWLQQDLSSAEDFCTQSLEISTRLGDVEASVWSLIGLGATSLHRDDLTRASTLLSEALHRSRGADFRPGVARCLHLLGLVAAAQDDPRTAAALLTESLRDHWSLGDQSRTASVLDAIASLLAEGTDAARAARLIGAADALRTRVRAVAPPIERHALEVATRRLTKSLGLDGYRVARIAGQVAAIDPVIDEVLRVKWTQPDDHVDAGDPEVLGVSALGSAQVFRGETEVASAQFSYAKPRELLYYLLDHGERTKQQIGSALWPWASAAQLRSNFHTTLHHLRHALGSGDRVVFRNGRYAFNRSLPYRYDVERFEGLLTEARESSDAQDLLSRAVSLYRGDFLTDLAGESWVDERRAELRRSFEQALLSLGRLHTSAGRHADAAEVLSQAIKYDPLLESAHRELMRSYAHAGEHARALRHFQSLVRMLRDELGAAPAAETVELRNRIRSVARL